MTTKGHDLADAPLVQAYNWWRLGFPVAVAGLALSLAVVGAILTNNTGGIGGLNFFVETLSARSGSLLGGTASVIPLGFAFGAGMVSAVNPCGFAMLPAYLGLYLGAEEKAGGRVSQVRRLGRALLVGESVTAGFVVLFGLAGAAIAGGARPLVHIVPWIGLAVGVFLVMAGAWLLAGGKLYTGFGALAASRIGGSNQIGARGYFIFGLSYGTASLSCTLPIFLAVVGTSLAVGGWPPIPVGGWLAATGQFISYALGMGLVIILLTLAVALFKGAMVGTLRKALPYIQPVSTGLMFLAGAYIVFYWLTIGGLLARLA